MGPGDRCIPAAPSLSLRLVDGRACRQRARQALAGVAAETGIAVLSVNVLSWLWGVQRRQHLRPCNPVMLRRELG